MLVNLMLYVCGHWLGMQSPIILPFNVMVVMFVTIVMLLVYWGMRFRQNKTVILVVFFLTGLLVSQGFGYSHFSQWQPKLGKHLYQVEGTVLYKQHRAYGDVVYLAISSIDGLEISSYWYAKQIKVVFSINDLASIPVFTLGDKIKFTALLRQVTGYENEFGFNYTQWLFGKKVIATGSYRSQLGFITQQKRTRSQSHDFIHKLKTVLQKYDYGKFMLALLLADKSLFDSEDHILLRNWGLSHLFAISGLHIGILLGLMILICRRFAYLFPQIAMNSVIHLVSISVIWWYLSILQFPVSATRATILMTLGGLMLHSHRFNNTFVVLAAVIVLSLMIDPTNILKSSWWLSVTAVFCLFLIFRLPLFRASAPNHQRPTTTDKHAVEKKSNAKKSNAKVAEQTTIFKAMLVKTGLNIKQAMITVRCYCHQLWLLQLALTLGMLPVVIYWMQGIAALGIINNLMVIPIFTIIVVPGLFLGSIILSFSEPLAKTVFTVMEVIFDLMWRGLHWLPYNDIWINLPQQTSWFVCALLIILLYFGFYRTTQNQGYAVTPTKLALWKVCIVVSAFGAAFSFGYVKYAHQSNLTLRVFDVGQGTSVLINNDESNLLYDLGPVFPSGSSATQHVVAPNLHNLAMTNIETLIISHHDTDHKGDLEALNEFTIHDFLNGCQSASSFYHWFQIKTKSQSLQTTLLWPSREVVAKQKQADVTKLSGNALSCVIKVTDKNTRKSVLLTGDIDLKVESILVKQHLAQVIDLKSDILVSSHHGSKFGTGSLFLRLVEPKIVLHSAGANNRFNFPSQEVVSRIASLGIEQLSTSEKGQIIIRLNHSETEPINVSYALDWTTPFWKRQNPFSIQHQIR